MKHKKMIFIWILNFLSGIYAGFKIKEKPIMKYENKIFKLKENYNILSRWMELKNDNIKIKDYLWNQGYRNIAIYGLGDLGEKLYRELLNEKVKVKYVIDRRENITCFPIKICQPNENLEKVDVIVVTIIDEFASIQKMLSSKSDNTIISLEYIIKECEFEKYR